jgi:predicted nucleic acid-binding protein
MSAAPLACVVDASVGIKLFIAEPFSDKVDALFAHLTLTTPARLCVPDLFFIECANILWKHVQRFGYAAAKARADVADMTALQLERYATHELSAAALDIALNYGLTAYDACYVALADRLHLPLVTADDKLARVAASSSFTVTWIGDFAVPTLPTP